MCFCPSFSRNSCHTQANGTVRRVSSSRSGCAHLQESSGGPVQVTGPRQIEPPRNDAHVTAQTFQFRLPHSPQRPLEHILEAQTDPSTQTQSTVPVPFTARPRQHCFRPLRHQILCLTKFLKSASWNKSFNRCSPNFKIRACQKVQYPPWPIDGGPPGGHPYLYPPKLGFSPNWQVHAPYWIRRRPVMPVFLSGAKMSPVHSQVLKLLRSAFVHHSVATRATRKPMVPVDASRRAGPDAPTCKSPAVDPCK